MKYRVYLAFTSCRTIASTGVSLRVLWIAIIPYAKSKRTYTDTATHTHQTNAMVVNNAQCMQTPKKNDVCARAFKYSVYIFNKIKRKLNAILFLHFSFSSAWVIPYEKCMNTIWNWIYECEKHFVFFFFSFGYRHKRKYWNKMRENKNGKNKLS